MKTFLALLAFGFATAGALSADPCPVVIRVPAGTAMPAELVPLLAHWQQTGQVTHVLLLTQGKPESAEHPAQFEALAVLRFADQQAADTWQKQDAPTLPSGLIVRQADIIASSGMEVVETARPVFIVNTYTPTVSPDKFGQYVTGYVKPLYEAMHATKLLASFTCYLERGATGKADALNVLEYPDAAALKAMGKRKLAIRDQVAAAYPSYGRYDKIKDTLRVDGHGTLAHYTAVAPAAQ